MPRGRGKSGKENKAKGLLSKVDAHTGAVQQSGVARSAAIAVETSVPFLDVPREDEDWRFARSFLPVGEEDLARAHLAEYGFAIFRDVISAAETAASRQEILSYAERVSEGFDVNDESTWGHWRSQQFGMPPPDPAAFWQPQLASNRRSPAVAAAFAQLLRCEPASLRCSHDRWALYPRGIRTRRNVHLDINPWLFTNGKAEIAATRASYGYATAADLYGSADNMVSAGA